MIVTRVGVDAVILSDLSLRLNLMAWITTSGSTLLSFRDFTLFQRHLSLGVERTVSLLPLLAFLLLLLPPELIFFVLGLKDRFGLVPRKVSRKLLLAQVGVLLLILR